MVCSAQSGTSSRATVMCRRRNRTAAIRDVNTFFHKTKEENRVYFTCDTSPADDKAVDQQLRRRSTDAAVKDRGRQLLQRLPQPLGDDSKGPAGVTSVRDDYSC